MRQTDLGEAGRNVVARRRQGRAPRATGVGPHPEAGAAVAAGTAAAAVSSPRPGCTTSTGHGARRHIIPAESVASGARTPAHRSAPVRRHRCAADPAYPGATSPPGSRPTALARVRRGPLRRPGERAPGASAARSRAAPAPPGRRRQVGPGDERRCSRGGSCAPTGRVTRRVPMVGPCLPWVPTPAPQRGLATALWGAGSMSRPLVPADPFLERNDTGPRLPHSDSQLRRIEWNHRSAS